jgi:hypothetical protein
VTALGSDPLQALLAAGAVPSSAYPNTSRYASIPTLAYDPGGGAAPIRYLARRLVPQLGASAVLGYHLVIGGDRLDLIAYKTLGDPELWWRLPDANYCIDPDTLTATVGRMLTIPLPPGTPGTPG